MASSTLSIRVLLFEAFFDASIIEMITTLLTGGCICVPSDTARRDNIAEVANELRISVAQLTPSTARLLQPKDIPSLETLSESVALVNGYGPSECSATSTVHPELHSISQAGNIGWASGCVCWVVDWADHKRLVPIGVVGELLIEGPIVGRGYLNDPDRTTSVFIPPPIWLRQLRGEGEGPSDRQLYKTGDLIQYKIDGEVEHYTWQIFPRARDMVVEVVAPNETGRTLMLVAFVCLHQHKGARDDKTDDLLLAPTDSFRAAIQAAESTLYDAIPSYMVPAVFLPLRNVPLSATGKTDQRRLRNHAAALSYATIESYHPSAIAKRQPTTPAECTLQALWAQVLNIPTDHIGADDSFFRLGGDSIAAMRLAAVARKQGLGLTVADTFQYPILCQYALTISPPRFDLDFASEPAPFSLLPAPKSDTFLAQIDPLHHTWHNEDIVDAFPTTKIQAEYATSYLCNYLLVNIPGAIDPDRLQAAYQSLAERHIKLRTVFFPSSEGVFQAIVQCAPPAMVCHTSDADLLQSSKALCRQDSQIPLPFGAMPFHISIVSGGPHNHVLILRLSHT
ncbi:hypothetical protein N7492_004229 [Penicillium capsulatum]|uniref:Carrier domain-containing protein n=1 Tax=Penicillium capsulatum TaxID=69766 RepID=A0A9W9I7H0_9EURO|nr:hypothetical protein N7492_004229 [Penicillium capsulatum]KAJ6136649.1 hypothetical protein N7512_001809 [Penicillium capsulatum]